MSAFDCCKICILHSTKTPPPHTHTMCALLCMSELWETSQQSKYCVCECVFCRVVWCSDTLCFNITHGGSRKVKKASGPSIVE